MESEPAIKSEPEDDVDYPGSVMAETDLVANVQTSIETDTAEIKQDPSEDEARIKTEPPNDLSEHSALSEQVERTKSRKRAQLEPQPSSPKKQKLNRTIIDLTEDDLIAEAWDMARLASPAAQAENLARLEFYQHRELKKLEIDLKPQWYTPESFFSRPASSEENDTVGQSDRSGNWSHGHVSHPAIRNSDASGYRRSERRVSRYMSEAYGSAGIGKSTTQKKPASTIGRKLLEKNLQKSVATGQAQIVGGGVNQDELILDYGRLCICKRIRGGTAIRCDNDGCEHRWYHLECVGLTEAPEGEWYCLPCRIARSNKHRVSGADEIDALNPELKQTRDHSDHKLLHEDEDEQDQIAPTPLRQKAPSARRTMTPNGARSAKRLRTNNRPRPATRARSATPSRSSSSSNTTTIAGPMTAPMSLTIRTRLSTLSGNNGGKTL